MDESGWFDEPQEWRALPEDDTPSKRFGESPLKDMLDVIVRKDAAGRPFLLRTAARSERKRLVNMAADYRRRYGKVGFAFEVRKLPSDDLVGIWTVWRPLTARPSAGTD